MSRSTFAIIFSNLYLLLFLVALQLGYDRLTWILFLFSPLNIIYLAYSVIRYGKYSGKELTENEEWGYEDVNKDEVKTLE